MQLKLKAPTKINLVLRVLGRRSNGYHDLLMLNEKFGVPSPEGSRLDISLNHEELGEMIGVSRETANRALSRFKNEKTIAVEGSAVTLIDPPALTKASQLKTEVL